MHRKVGNKTIGHCFFKNITKPLKLLSLNIIQLLSCFDKIVENYLDLFLLDFVSFLEFHFLVASEIDLHYVLLVYNFLYFLQFTKL